MKRYPLGMAWMARCITCLASISCAQGGQTGDLSGFVSDDEPDVGAATAVAVDADCNNDEEEVSDADQIVPGLGFSPNDLLGAVQGGDSNIVWDVGGESQLPAEEVVSIRIEYVGGRFLHRFRNDAHLPTSEDASLAESSEFPCPPELSVEVEMTVATSDGTLNEKFQVALHTTDLSVIWFSKALSTGELRGQLDLEPDSDGRGFSGLRIAGQFSRYGATGEVSYQASSQDMDVEPEYTRLAVWPSDDRCGVGDGAAPSIPIAPDVELRHFDTREALTAFSDLEPFTLRWSAPENWEGQVSELSLDVEAARYACITVSPDGSESVTYPAQVSARTSDGRLRGEYQALVLATGLERKLTYGQLDVHLENVPSAEADALGLGGLGEEAGGRDVSLVFTLSRDVGAGDVTGWLQVHTVGEGECPESLIEDAIESSMCAAWEPVVEAHVGAAAQEIEETALP